MAVWIESRELMPEKDASRIAHVSLLVALYGAFNPCVFADYDRAAQVLGLHV